MPRLVRVLRDDLLPKGYYIRPSTDEDYHLFGRVAVALNLPSRGTWIGPLQRAPIPGWEFLSFDADALAVISVANALANQSAKLGEAAPPVVADETIQEAYRLYLVRSQDGSGQYGPIRLRELSA